jgi:trimethylamine monooxygenase
MQCQKYGSTSVTISYRSHCTGFTFPEGITEVPLLSKLEGNTAHFIDGTTREIDAIILCTGYISTYPFMEANLSLKAENTLWIDNLYKGTVFYKNWNLHYIGMHDQFYTLTMFDI